MPAPKIFLDSVVVVSSLLNKSGGLILIAMATREPGRTAGPNSWRSCVSWSSCRHPVGSGGLSWTVKSFAHAQGGARRVSDAPAPTAARKEGTRKGGGEGGDDAGEGRAGRRYWHTTGRLVNTYTGRVLAKVEGMETVRPIDWWAEADSSSSSSSGGGSTRRARAWSGGSRSCYEE